ncbi:MAG: hypothetical protein JSV01_04300 [Desulfobacterales bacterium]|nr:MAG: hypothetical protein JSV01_04300 [Desulfobacterales bacterium]
MDVDLKLLTPRDYFERTSHVVRHLYLGIGSCHQLWEEATAFWTPREGGPPKTEKEKADLDIFLAKGQEYFGKKLSEGVLCGAILQVAASGILRFSKNATLPPSCRDLFKGIKLKERQLKFCIGQERYGVPEGLIIYAGRNQYAHWEEEKLRDKLNVRIFDKLNSAFQKHTFMDLAFDLSNPTIHIYADFLLLGVLEWKTYGAYLRGMKELLEAVQTGPAEKQ